MADTTMSPHLGLTPYITVHDAVAAIEWYKTVFGAIESVRYVGKDGRIGHCELVIYGSTLMISDEYPDHGAISPRTLGGTAFKLNLGVDDVDAIWTVASSNGADGQRPPQDQAYGQRSCSFSDPFGHQWIVDTTRSSPTAAEIQAASGDEFTIITPGPADDDLATVDPE